MIKAWLLRLSAIAVLMTASTATALAQNPNFPGHLGVYVAEDGQGMQITGFIRNTPAARLGRTGAINSGDTIVTLGGRRTRTLEQLLNARNRIPGGQEAKMVLVDEFGDKYHVWISPGPRAAASVSEFGEAEAPKSAPYEFKPGGKGTGDDKDFRPIGDGEGDTDGGTDEGDGNFRPKSP